MPHGLHSFSSEGLTVFSYIFLLILTKTKSIPSIKVNETEESTSSTSLVYNHKEGKWQKSLINDSNDSTSDNECESEK